MEALQDFEQRCAMTWFIFVYQPSRKPLGGDHSYLGEKAQNVVLESGEIPDQKVNQQDFLEIKYGIKYDREKEFKDDTRIWTLSKKFMSYVVVAPL